MPRKRDRHQEAVRARASVRGLTDAKASSKLRAVAEKCLRRDKKLFADDPHGLEVIEADHDRLMRIASSIRAGNLEGAYNYASHLDTLVREEIPLDVWMYIGGRGVHE